MNPRRQKGIYANVPEPKIVTAPERSKRVMTNEDFVRLRADSKRLVPLPMLNRRIDEAASRIESLVARYGKAAIGWSAGKDSRVLELIARRVGIVDGVLGISQFEFPSFLDWLEENQPKTIETIRSKQDYQYLRSHPEMIFAENSSIVAKWCSLKHISAQYAYAKRNDVRIMLLGRRYQEGNYIGDSASFSFVKDGIVVASPIADWTHTEIFSAIEHYGIDLPPIYDWEFGYLNGPGSWAGFYWKKLGVKNGWEFIFRYEPSVVFQAAVYIPDAYNYLKEIDSIPSGMTEPLPIIKKQ